MVTRFDHSYVPHGSALWKFTPGRRSTALSALEPGVAPFSVCSEIALIVRDFP